MDETKQMTEARKQLAKLEREINEHVARRRVTEKRLDDELGALRILVSRRGLTIAALANADSEAAKKVNADVDKLEAQIRETERRGESLRTLLRGLDESLTGLATERDRIGQQIAAEENAKEFAAGRARLEQGFADLHGVLATARRMMGELNTDAAAFGQRFSGAGYGVIAPLFDEFMKVEANQDQHGFRHVYGYRADFRVVLNGMSPRS